MYIKTMTIIHAGMQEAFCFLPSEMFATKFNILSTEENCSLCSIIFKSVRFWGDLSRQLIHGRYVYASENCSCVTNQYSDPETVHGGTSFEITDSNSMEEVQGQLVLRVDIPLVFSLLQFSAYLYFICSNPNNTFWEHTRNLAEVPEQLPFAIVFTFHFHNLLLFPRTINYCISGQTKHQKILCFTCQPKSLVKKGECVCCCKPLCNRYHAWQTITFNRHTQNTAMPKGRKSCTDISVWCGQGL